MCKSWSIFRKLWDFIFISHSSLLCSSRSFILEFKSSSKTIKFFYLAYDSCKSLNPCKTTSQPEHSSTPASLYSCKINFAARANIKEWSSLSCSQIDLFRRKWRNEKSGISRTKIYESDFGTISKNGRRQHSKKQQLMYWERFVYISESMEFGFRHTRQWQSLSSTCYKKRRKNSEPKKR